MKLRLPLAVAAVAALAASRDVRARPRADRSPATALAQTSQMFTLAVPTEKEDATTTKVVLTVPDGLRRSTSFVPAAGWKRRPTRRGTGEDGAIRKVTWTGGATPTGEAACSSFPPAPTRPATLHVQGPSRPTPTARSSTGPGAEDADEPAPTSRRRLARRRRRRLELDARDRRAGRRRVGRRARRDRARPRRAAGSWREAPLAGASLLALAVVVAALVLPAAASAHAYLVRTVPSASGITAGRRPRSR